MTSREGIVQNHRDHVFFSWVPQQVMTNPIVVDRAKGVYFWDVDGTQYIDFSSQLMNVNIGHGHPKVQAAVNAQMEKLPFAYPGTATDIKGRTAAKLAEITPGDLNKVLFTLGGAEAIDNSIKIARQYTGRHKIVTRYRSYHGASMGATTAGGDPRRLANEPGGISGIVRVHDPYAYRCPFGYAPEGNPQAYIDHVIQTIEFEGPENVAAILMESITGSSGLIIPPDGYWQALREYADKNGILLIADEVMSGFGRTGKMFAIEHYGVTPDIMTLAKGLTNAAVPMGAVVVSEQIFDAFMDGPDNLIELFHGYTYSSHPLACAAALATLDLYEKENLFARAADLEGYWQDAVHGLQGLANIIDIRNIGLTAGIELAPRDGAPGARGYEVLTGCFEAGALVRVTGDIIALSPPLIIDEGQIDALLAIVAGVVENTG